MIRHPKIVTHTKFSSR